MRLAILAALLPALVGLDAAAQTVGATITFPAMVTYGTRPAPRVSGTVRAGTRVKIKYDRGRIMNTCYGTQGDQLRFRFDGQSGYGTVLLWTGNGNNPQVDPVLDIPAAAERLELYFERYGVNKSMTGAQPCFIAADAAVKLLRTDGVAPKLTAQPDWTHPASKPVLRGRQLAVEYKRVMQSQCRAGGQVPLAGVSFGYKNDAGADTYLSLAKGKTTLTAPVNAYDLVFWFRGLEGTCATWESNHGRNWRLPLYWAL